MPPQERNSPAPSTASEDEERNKGILNSGFILDESESSRSSITESQPESVRRDLDFDDLLPHIGEFGTYQQLLFIAMIPFAFFVSFVYFSQIFMTVTPEDHWCMVPELANLTQEQRIALAIPKDNSTESGHSRCTMYDMDFREVLKSGETTPGSHWPVKPCSHGWEFNFTDVPYPTISSEMEWVCDRDNYPALAQSVFFCGAIVGGLLFGWLADKYGRVPALVGSNIVGLAAGVGTAFCNTFVEFTICRFLVGFAFDNCFTMMYILVLEYVGPRWRTFVANMSIALFFTLASCLLPWIAIWSGNWRLYTILTSAPLALAFATPFLVPESVRWLISQGRLEQALTILKKFEKINKRKIPDNVLKDFTDSSLRIQKEMELSPQSYSVADLVRTPRLRRTVILLIVIWMAISLVFDGHVRNVGTLGLDVFLTFTVASVTELPADTFLTFVLDRWGRRWLACGSMVVSGIFSLLAMVSPIGVWTATLAIMGRFAVNISYNIGLQYAAELLPTVVRAQGVALVHIMGYLASILAPFVVYAANISRTLPLLILGVLGILGGFLCLSLPETMDRLLPQTIHDGEDFGRGDKFWDIPCISRKNVDDNDVELPKPEVYRKRNSIALSDRFDVISLRRGYIGGIASRNSIRGSIRSIGRRRT